MFEYKVEIRDGFKIARLQGRLDGTSAPELKEKLEDLVLRGTTSIAADFSKVSYVSSAGLRALLAVQKQLRSVSGEIVLFQVEQNVANVFRMSGFNKLFKSLESEQEVESAFGMTKLHEETSITVNDIQYRQLKRDADKGTLSVFGTYDKFSSSQYAEEDVVSVNANSISYGTGLATIGNSFDEYRKLFGEAVIIDGNLFYYPAIKQPVVDCILRSGNEVELDYRFLRGFGFNGEISHLLSFDGEDESYDLNTLFSALSISCGLKSFGVVLLAESRGLWGIHLKQVPLREFCPDNGKSIFDEENFCNWLNFPVDPSDRGSIVIASGLVVMDRDNAKSDFIDVLPKGGDSHIHGVVLSSGPFNTNLQGFQEELKRVLRTFEAKKVQHLFGKSRFSRGIIAAIELEV